ncbi:hypothetical protein RD110_04760 [Rhodoferax koreense]|uniref:Glyoxalase-like domain-containing protein n=1 Tax=Rhodoferax koreensis TaxID=1842727 RepID=A0A1P8JS70_9BURK|nr:VOC family protein [Rhodoferax koreense]APW36602.1 hypothetical protein RD110_04760 [Rhodoferax koreense]
MPNVPNTASKLDHLVILAASLDEGVAWCEATLGIIPGPGGAHALMGTHNRLVKVASPAFPRAYVEIIAIDPAATPSRGRGLRRWFDMDDPALREKVTQNGPQLVHWVASVPDASNASAAWRMLGLDRGPVLTASRLTQDGLLQWQITVRDDGQRLLDGTLPTLIQWGEIHPADNMPDSGVSLQAFQLQHPQGALLQAALQGVGLSRFEVHTGPAQLVAVLQTPKGRVTLCSSPCAQRPDHQ